MSRLDDAFRAAGAAAWGGVSYAALLPWMGEHAQARVQTLCPGASTVLVAAFPYYAGEGPGNLSRYARGEDYHLVVPRKLGEICNILIEKYPEESFCPSADSSPLPEREAARLAGIGLRGRNGLVIVPPYGSYVFLGTILTSAPLELSAASPAPLCPDCGACIRACPAGALGGAEFAQERCLSDITQRKGALTPEEEALVKAGELIWGCDTCQTVCPYNKAALFTPLPEFRENRIDSLTGADLEGLTNRSFREKYPGRAFTWRGPGVLRRNLEIKEKPPCSDGGA